MSRCQQQPRDWSVEWFDLQKHAQLKLQQTAMTSAPAAAAAGGGDWDSLLMRFRKLREALTADREAQPQLKREVYEASADVCAAAGNFAELLKCLQQLTNSIYPALERQQQQQQQQPQQQTLGSNNNPTNPQRRLHSAWSDDNGSEDGSSSERLNSAGTTSNTPTNSRHAEVAAALLLYFVCVPARPVVQEITKQLRAAAKPLRPCFSCSSSQGSEYTTLIQDLVYRQAVLDTAAALRGNYCAFLRSLHRQPRPPPLLVRAVMCHHVERLRLAAVHKVGVAYRMLPTTALQRWLWLQQDGESSNSSSCSCNSSSSHRANTAAAAVGAGAASAPAFQQVVGLLQRAAADCGSKAAGIAAAQCVEQGSLPATLQFRAQ